MSYASVAVTLMQAYAKERFPDDWRNMARVTFAGNFRDAFDIKEQGTHKYIPADTWNATLELPEDSGIYSYMKLGDDSFVLLTCCNGLAVLDLDGLRFID